jgi:hypothetical protein
MTDSNGGVTLDTLRPYLRDEVSNVWRLWKAGIFGEDYARADEPGVSGAGSERNHEAPAWPFR